MTKEEALDIIIENYKNDDKYEQDDVRTAYCAVTECSDCVFRHGQDCTNTIAEALIDRLLKAEEHQETNLEHYIIRGIGACITVENDCEKWGFRFKKGAEKQFFDENNKSVLNWLLAPYEEPKPKYKLSKFEHDLLDFCKQYNDTQTIEDWAVLTDMQNKGHYKGIPKETKVRDILDNAEVITND